MEEVLYKITTSGEGVIREKGSKFLGYAYPLQNVEEVSEYLGTLKKQYFDARHHCYAYRTGVKGAISFATDDREPAHSAGTPILSAIRSEKLTDTLVVVVRYFGGTKLGIRGLIEAYRTSALEALQSCKREEVIPTVTFSIEYSYPQTSEINQVLHRFPTQVVEAFYTDTCKQILSVKEKDFSQLYKMLKSLPIHVDTLSNSDV